PEPSPPGRIRPPDARFQRWVSFVIEFARFIEWRETGGRACGTISAADNGCKQAGGSRGANGDARGRKEPSISDHEVVAHEANVVELTRVEERKADIPRTGSWHLMDAEFRFCAELGSVSFYAIFSQPY